MKQIILNPGIFLTVAASAVVYFLLAINLSKSRRVRAFLHISFTAITLIAIPGTDIFPINRLHPKWLIFPSLNTMILLAIYASVAIIVNSRFKHLLGEFLSLLSKDIFLGFLMVFLLFSGSWSAVPEISFRYSVGLVFASALAAHIGRTYSWKQLSVFLRFGNAFVAFFGLLFSIFIPSIGVNEKGWKGLLIHPNILAAFLALTIAIWFLDAIQNPRDRKLSIPIILGLFFVLIKTNSTGGLLVTAILLSLVSVMSFFKKFFKSVPFRPAFAGFVVFIVASLIISLLAFENIETVFAAFGKDLTFTGRADFWAQIIGYVQEKPLLGYGHRGFWLEPGGPASFVRTNSGFRPVEAHNGFLELTLDLGITGLILFLLSFGRSTYLAFRFALQSSSLDGLIPLLIMIFLMSSNTVESRLLTVDYIWFYYILSAAKLNTNSLHTS
ncbi:MAG: O-antigen ligase family protein [Drouetiella hepatica Uher 2000/2452]|jgi:O-antigen ligase|uniref:O-antigen ligase family protein n=1 Tax=Drouetiella hepatica Uher 2000/2452 TaxID=904376 RepID=A0A951UM53_9CYAN|nr:O-antigen ligase family protein [Drouetiella hepatica Uher 2000/2452]